MAGELPCPMCGSPLEAHAWRDAEHGQCRSCRARFEFVPYPALHAERSAAVPRATAVPEDATCYFHPENRADKVCEGCGRLLCPVCGIDFGGRLLCPPCIKAGSSSESGAIRGRVLYDRISTTLAVLSIFVPPLGPAVLVLIAVCWKKPGSVVSRSKWRFLISALLALTTTLLWTLFFARIWMRRRHP